jgi:hypothetical protein
VEIPHKREKTLKKKIVVFKSIIGSLERGCESSLEGG